MTINVKVNLKILCQLHLVEETPIEIHEHSCHMYLAGKANVPKIATDWNFLASNLPYLLKILITPFTQISKIQFTVQL